MLPTRQSTQAKPQQTQAAQKRTRMRRNSPLAAVCFKTVADPFVGKMSFIRCIRQDDSRCSRIQRKNRRKRKNRQAALRQGRQAGGYFCSARRRYRRCYKAFKRNDRRYNLLAKDVLHLKGVQFPTPCLSMAVKAVKKGEEDKVSSGLRKLMEKTRQSYSIPTRKQDSRFSQVSASSTLMLSPQSCRLSSALRLSLRFRESHTERPSAKRSRLRADTRSRPAVTVSSAMFISDSSRGIQRTLYLLRKSSAAQFPSSTSPPLKRVSESA